MALLFEEVLLVPLSWTVPKAARVLFVATEDGGGWPEGCCLLPLWAAA